MEASVKSWASRCQSFALQSSSWDAELYMDDPIVEEARRIRERHASRFDYDLDAILNDIGRMERERVQTLVVLEPKRAVKVDRRK